MKRAIYIITALFTFYSSSAHSKIHSFKLEYFLFMENLVGKETWWVSETVQLKETVIYPNHQKTFTQQPPDFKTMNDQFFFIGIPLIHEREIYTNKTIQVINDKEKQFITLQKPISFKYPIADFIEISENQDIISEIQTFIKTLQQSSLDQFYTPDNKYFIGSKKIKPQDMIMGKGLYWGTLYLQREIPTTQGIKYIQINSIQLIDDIPEVKLFVPTEFTQTNSPLFYLFNPSELIINLQKSNRSNRQSAKASDGTILSHNPKPGHRHNPPQESPQVSEKEQDNETIAQNISSNKDLKSNEIKPPETLSKHSGKKPLSESSASADAL